MRLRLILIVLSLLAFFSATAGGAFYYSVLKESAFKEAERQAFSRLEMIQKNLSSMLSENIKPVRTLAGIEEIIAFLSASDQNSLASANGVLDHFNSTLDADVCYLMDRQGNTVASSNRNDPDSFVGKNFAFRPYFQQAIHGSPFTYLALGTASGKRGVYYSYPVYGPEEVAPIGIVVIKMAIKLIEQELGLSQDEIVLVADPRGVVFISNREDWLYHLVWRIPVDEIAHIQRSRQFGGGPWVWTGLEPKGSKYMADQSGNRYLMHKVHLDNYPGWNVFHLRNLKAITNIVFGPLMRITAPIVLMLCVFIGLSVLFLYRQASKEIYRRKVVETALRESDNRYRSLYNNTPAMLHSVDISGRLISVSNHWCDVSGFLREEVLGKRITDFFTESSKKHAEQIVFPAFFKNGYCKDVPYQFVKKDGQIIDILLSAFGDHDEAGNIIRSLAVSIDVTERNRAVEALKAAKEKLSRYSKDLERQVSIRTKEITNILKYTPDVVYVKDREGKYILVNSRFEELFGICNEEIRGKTDYEIAPKKIADQFRCNDQQVLEAKQPCQLEESVPHKDGMHTYLSVKFPVFDETGLPSGVCGISTDITAVKKAQDQLRRLSGSIILSQEKERSAIARELHDELGQVLTALRLDSVWLAEKLKKTNEKAAERALTMCDLIDQTIKDVRGIAIRLRPGVLDDLGLVDALEWYTADFEKRSGITCIFEHHQIPNISNTVATAAYRIAQEALTNVARHASAGRVDVILETHGDMLNLTVSDDGCGFDIKTLSEFEGVGVAGMRERAGLAGGILEVDSRPEKGSRVSFRVSLSLQTEAV